jgi:MFS family permease
MKTETLATVSRPLQLYRFFKDQTFRSLRHRNYRFYFLGQFVSFIGSWMQSTALMWIVYIKTNDPRWPALLMIAQFVPTLILGPLTGAIADRFAKRNIVMITQVLFAITASILTGLLLADILVPWLVFSLLLVNGIIQAIDFPTRLAYVPELVPREDLVNAIGLNSLLFNSARAIGPAGAGVLFWTSRAFADWGWIPVEEVTRYGAIVCFSVNAFSYVAVLFALWSITVPGRASQTSESRDASTWSGYMQIFRNLRLMALLILTGLFSIFGWPVLSLFPAYTRLGLGLEEKEYSTLVSGLGAGALCAALTTATFLNSERRGWFLILGASVALAGMISLAFVQSLTWAVVAASGLGFGLILYLSTGQSMMQMSVADNARGRAMSLWAMMLSASAPLGHLLAGQAASWWPIRDVMLVLSLGLGIIWLMMIVLFLQRNNREPSELA